MNTQDLIDAFYAWPKLKPWQRVYHYLDARYLPKLRRVGENLIIQRDAIEERYQRNTVTLVPAVSAVLLLASSSIFHFDDEPIHIVVLIFVGILIGTLITMEKRRRRE